MSDNGVIRLSEMAALNYRTIPAGVHTLVLDAPRDGWWPIPSIDALAAHLRRPRA